MGNQVNIVLHVLLLLMVGYLKINEAFLLDSGCPRDMVMCNRTSVCLPLKYICDGIAQCQDAEDERNCHTRESGCGGPFILRGSSGSFSTMNYPVAYDDNAYCHWHISVPKGENITVNFVGVFDLEKPRRGGECIYDGVSVYGKSAKQFHWPVLFGRYCGKITPGSVKTDGNEVFIEFQSDRQTTGRGFNITWTTSSTNNDTTVTPTPTDSTSIFPTGSAASECPPGDMVMCNKTSVCLPVKYLCDGDADCPDGEDERGCDTRESGCGGPYLLTGSTGTLSSMNYPEGYEHKINCYWHIVAPEGEAIWVGFVGVFDIERARHDEECIYDGVSVYGKSANQSSSSPVLFGRYCGNTSPGLVRTDGNEVFVEFQTDGQMTGSGFKIMWNSFPITSAPPPTTTTAASTTKGTEDVLHSEHKSV